MKLPESKLVDFFFKGGTPVASVSNLLRVSFLSQSVVVVVVVVVVVAPKFKKQTGALMLPAV